MGFVLLVPLVLAVLLLVAAYLGLFGLSVDPKLHPSDILSIFTTTFLALVIQHLLVKRTKRADSEKDLILDQVKDAAAAIKAVREPLQQAVGQIPLRTESVSSLISAFERCVEELGTLEVVLQNSHCSDLSDACVQISDVMVRYKNSVTGGNFPARTFSSSDVGKSAVFQRELAKQLQLLSLSIHKQ